MARFALLCFVLLFVYSEQASGQSERAGDTPTYQDDIYMFVYTADTSFYGRLVDISLEKVVLDQEGKLLTLPIRSVTKIMRVEKQDPRSARPFPNPNHHRYLFAPSAYMLEQGDGYYQNIYLFVNQFTYGVTDWFSMSAGFDWLTLFAGEPAFLVSPKFGARLDEKVGIGGGSFSVFIPSEGESMHIIYGVVTYGTNETNVSAGVGRFYSPSDFYGNGLAYSFNAMARTDESTAIVLESWFVYPEHEKSEWFVVPAVRFMSEKITWDIGVVFNGYLIKEAIPLPYADFVYHW